MHCLLGTLQNNVFPVLKDALYMCAKFEFALPSPVLRLALNQSRRDLSDAQAKVNEYRYLKDNDNSMAQTAFDDLERRYERLKTEMAQVMFPERC